MDFHIRFGTAHRRLTRPAHSSCPYPGDEWRKLPPRHQQEGAAATGPGAKPKHQTKETSPPKHESAWKHEINRGFIAPFLLTRSVHFHAAIWHNLSPPLTTAFDRSSSWQFEASPTGRLRRVILHLSHSMTLARLLDTTPPSLLTT